MNKRQVFFSFHYSNDNWRAAQVRNIGCIDNSSSILDNDWEKVKEKDEYRIKEWIDEQLKKRSCLVVLIGEKTANRKWINYEIKRAVELDKGIVGIYINKLKDSRGLQGKKGENPFDYIFYRNKKLSNYVEVFESSYFTSTFVYDEINKNMSRLIEEAIRNKPSTW
jgi:hypothetical protein